MKKYIEKYRSIPIQARASLWFLICGILQNGLSIITLPIFTRVLSTEQYGLSSTYFAWNDLIVVICTLRLSYGVFDKGMIRYSEQRDKFEAALLGLTSTIAIIMTTLFLVFHNSVEKLLGMSFSLCLSLFVVQIFAPSLLFWTARNKYEYKYRNFVIVTVFTTVTCTFLNLTVVLLLRFDRGVVKILSYQAVWAVVYIIFYIMIFARGKIFFNLDMWKYALSFNLPLIPYFLSTIVLDKADRIMIADICGQLYVALYSVSYNLGRLMVLLTSAVDATFTPWLYQNINKNQFSNCKKISTAILTSFVGLSTLFMLFAPELIKIFAPDEYANAVYIIPPVVTSYFFVMLYGLVSKVEFYYERTKAIAVITVSAAILDIMLNTLAIPRFGYIAAGYTTLISYMFMAIGHLFLSGKIAKEHKIYDDVFAWNRILLLSIVMIFIMLLVNVLYINALLRYMILALLIITLIVKRKLIINLVKTLV